MQAQKIVTMTNKVIRDKFLKQKPNKKLNKNTTKNQSEKY